MYTVEDSKLILDGAHDDFDSFEPVHIEILEHTRWHVYKQYVFERNDGTFWAVNWAVGATEMQENEIDEPPYQAHAVEKTVKVWVWEPVK